MYIWHAPHAQFNERELPKTQRHYYDPLPTTFKHELTDRTRTPHHKSISLANRELHSDNDVDGDDYTTTHTHTSSAHT